MYSDGNFLNVCVLLGSMWTSSHLPTYISDCQRYLGYIYSFCVSFFLCWQHCITSFITGQDDRRHAKRSPDWLCSAGEKQQHSRYTDWTVMTEFWNARMLFWDRYVLSTGCKMNNINVVYTPWSNLKKTADMDVGQIGFHRQKEVRRDTKSTRQTAWVYCVK